MSMLKSDDAFLASHVRAAAKPLVQLRISERLLDEAPARAATHGLAARLCERGAAGRRHRAAMQRQRRRLHGHSRRLLRPGVLRPTLPAAAAAPGAAAGVVDRRYLRQHQHQHQHQHQLQLWQRQDSAARPELWAAGGGAVGPARVSGSQAERGSRSGLTGQHLQAPSRL